jgi:hypothetical protein
MNAVPRPCFSRAPRPFNVLPEPQTAPSHREYRERDFGIGYGNSSGYGRDRSYTSNGFAPLFRCA